MNRRIRVVLVAVVALTTGCKRSLSITSKPAPLHAADQCGDCHSNMLKQWAPSAHARAVKSPLFVSMRTHAGPRGGADCLRCHAPLAVGDEGVTCEVCHSLRSVTPSRTGASFELVHGDLKFGPLCDAKESEAHRMGCSPLHESGDLCGGCHLLYGRGAEDQPLPIFTEYEEWKRGPYSQMNIPCQDCHMPGDKSVVSKNGRVREQVPHHGFLARANDLRQRALTMRVWVTDEKPKLGVRVALNNEGAGHSVPTGLPERRIILTVRVVNGAGVERARKDQIYGRFLVDAAGREVPFYAAARVASDNRIEPKETRMETFLFDVADSAAQVLVDVTWMEISAALARDIGYKTAPQAVRLLKAKLEFAARKALPQSMWVKGIGLPEGEE